MLFHSLGGVGFNLLLWLEGLGAVKLSIEASSLGCLFVCLTGIGRVVQHVKGDKFACLSVCLRVLLTFISFNAEVCFDANALS